MERLEQKEKIRMLMPMLESGFINAICLHDTRKEELNEYARLFDQKDSAGFVLVIEFLKMNSIQDILESNQLYEAYRDILKGVCNCIVGPLMSNRIVVYINMYAGEDEYERKKRSIEIAEKLVLKTENLFQNICIGIGNYHVDMTDAPISYREAIKALRYVNKSSLSDEKSSRIFHITDDIAGPELENDT